MQQITMNEPRYYPHWLGQYRITEGVRDLARDANANWLIDRIATTTAEKFRDVDHVVWMLEVQDRRSVLTATDGDENQIFVESIDITDFPRASVTVWVMKGVILLPSEY